MEEDSHLFLAVEHGRDPVRLSSLEYRCRLGRSAELEAVLSRQEEELDLAAGPPGIHRGRRRDTEVDFASRDRLAEAALAEDSRRGDGASTGHQ